MRRQRPGAGWRLLAGGLLLAAGAPATAQRDSASDALAGHRAEMQQGQDDVDPLRRLMFFDPVDVETTPFGVPCDHLAARRPEVVAGSGWVAVLQSREATPRRLRYWRPPGDPSTPASVTEAARKKAAEAFPGLEFDLLGVRNFAWCR